MSVKQRGRSWQVDVKVGRVRVRQAVRGDKRKAQLRETEIRTRLLKQRAPDRGLEEALLKYFEEHVPRMKDARAMKCRAKNIRPLLAGKNFDDIPKVVTAIKAFALTPATINRHLAMVRRICNLAWKEWGWLDRPAHISLLREDNKRHVYLTKKQVDALARRCSPGARDAIRLAAYTGFRRSEVFQLSKANIIDGYIVLDASAKTGLPRVVPVHDAIRPILKRLPVRTTDALLRKDFEAARVAIGLPDLHFHDLRHTFASWCAQSGLPLYTIGELLGHSQTQTTKRYSHLGRGDLKVAISLVKP